MGNGKKNFKKEREHTLELNVKGMTLDWQGTSGLFPKTQNVNLHVRPITTKLIGLV